MRSILVSLLTSFTFFAASTASAHPGHFSHAIAEANLAFEKGIASQDANAIADLYTTDAVLMIDGLPTLEGKDGARAFATGAFQSGLKSIDLVTESLTVLSPGSTVAEVGNATLQFQPANAAPFTQTARYKVTWKYTSGKWRIAYDVTNNTVVTPAPTPTQAK